MQLFLGVGNDQFNIDTTVPTVNELDNTQTMLMVYGGGGSNTINVTASSDPLVLYGAESASGVPNTTRSTQSAQINGNSAWQITKNFGTGDTINAAGATGTVVIVGGPDGTTC